MPAPRRRAEPVAEVVRGNDPRGGAGYVSGDELAVPEHARRGAPQDQRNEPRQLRTAKGITVRCTLSPTGRRQGEGCENPPVILFAVLTENLPRPAVTVPAAEQAERDAGPPRHGKPPKRLDTVVTEEPAAQGILRTPEFPTGTAVQVGIDSRNHQRRRGHKPDQGRIDAVEIESPQFPMADSRHHRPDFIHRRAMPPRPPRQEPRMRRQHRNGHNVPAAYPWASHGARTASR